jgi:hypothetical protein
MQAARIHSGEVMSRICENLSTRIKHPVHKSRLCAIIRAKMMLTNAVCEETRYTSGVNLRSSAWTSFPQRGSICTLLA